MRFNIKRRRANLGIFTSVLSYSYNVRLPDNVPHVDLKYSANAIRLYPRDLQIPNHIQTQIPPLDGVIQIYL